MQQTAIFMTYSLFFQVADTFAAPLQGILRGYKDTTVPFLLGVFSYWCISIPLGMFLDHVTNLGPYAYWIGLISSLVVSGICYQLRLWQIEKSRHTKKKSGKPGFLCTVNIINFLKVLDN